MSEDAGKKVKQPRKARRNHAAELAELQGRVTTALRLLGRMGAYRSAANEDGSSNPDSAILLVAIETLEGK